MEVDASCGSSGRSKYASFPTKILPHVPKSRKVYIVLFWIVLTHCLFNYTVYNIGGILEIGTFSTLPLYIIGASQITVLLMYPIAGIIGEVCFTRFNILRAGTVLMLIAIIAAPVALVLLMFVDQDLSLKLGGISIAIVLIPFQIGLAIFDSNIIQFGTDQLLFASSDMLSNFVHWSFWSMHITPSLIVFISCLFNPLLISSDTSISYVMVGPIVQGIGLAVIIPVILMPCTKRHLQIEKKTKKNPLRLIFEVLKYAAMNKYPLARSAFTYNDEECHSRINFAKRRFGGPFTTEQVEDVKSFWRILLLLSSLFGFLVLDNTGVFVLQYGNASFAKHVTALESIPQCFIANYEVTFFVVVIGVPMHKLVVAPYLYRYLPNMIKRIGLGLFFVCVSLAVEVTISFFLNDAFLELGFIDECSKEQNTSDLQNVNFTNSNLEIYYSLILIPQAINGLCLLLVFLTAIEFILAQAPRSMQGLLIGFWYSFQSINALASTIFSTSSAGCKYPYYLVRLVIAVLSFFVFLYASVWYKGRMRQELSLIKLKTIIENYTVRNLRHDHDAPDYRGKADPYCHDPSDDNTHSLFTIYSIISESVHEN